MDTKEECVESTTTPDDGVPNINEKTSESKNKQGDHPSKRNPRFSGRNENRNSTWERKSFGGPNESLDHGNRRGNREFDVEHLGGRGRDFGNQRETGGWNSFDFYREKLFEISGPTHELPPIDLTEKKFTGRNRLYVGNLPADMTEENFKNMFTEYGEICDVFLNPEKRFGFVVFDYHRNAEKAKLNLDGKHFNNDRQLKIRFSPRGTTIKVSNLAPTVTNELLYHAFSVFGEIERAIVYKDERGNSTCVGEVDFARKKSATQAVAACTEGCFFLTGSLRPCIVEIYEPVLDTDGFSEKSVQWRNNEFMKDREVGPWLAKPNSFEHQFGTDWKQLRILFHKKEEALKKELKIEEEKMMARMDFVKFEYETEMLKKQLEERERYRQQRKLNLEEKERLADELLSKNVLELRKTEEEIMSKFARHEEEMLLRQKERNVFNEEERPSADFYGGPNNSRWDDRESYWQRESVPPVSEDVASQESRGRNSFLEEPGQVWKRLDKDNVVGDDLYQRREDDMPLEENYHQGWKRTWPENYNYPKRNRY